jgi:predicted transcriptional regulator
LKTDRGDLVPLDDASFKDGAEADLAKLTADVVSAFVSNNKVAASDLPDLISEVSGAFRKIVGPQEPAPEPQEPAVPVRKSIKPDSITCLECGKSFKSLKRHIRTDHALEPQEYRAKWELKNDYPMVAPNYAEARSKLARDMGLGRKRETPEKPKGTRQSKGTKATAENA